MEIGSGTGRLALRLAARGARVTAIEPATALLGSARKADRLRSVNWVNAEVDAVDFARATWGAVVCFETFHLLPQPGQLVERIGNGLQAGGALAVGWRTLEVETLLKDQFLGICADVGLSATWGYWTCPNLESLTERTGMFHGMMDYEVTIPSETSAGELANYWCSIGLTASLDGRRRALYEARVRECVNEHVTGRFTDRTVYGLKVLQRR